MTKEIYLENYMQLTKQYMTTWTRPDEGWRESTRWGLERKCFGKKCHFSTRFTRAENNKCVAQMKNACSNAVFPSLSLATIIKSVGKFLRSQGFMSPSIRSKKTGYLSSWAAMLFARLSCCRMVCLRELQSFDNWRSALTLVVKAYRPRKNCATQEEWD